MPNGGKGTTPLTPDRDGLILRYYAESEPAWETAIEVDPGLPMRLTVRLWHPGEHRHDEECIPIDAPPGFVGCVRAEDL
jgi:hypothetical protein